MKEKLRELKYKPWTEITNEKMRNIADMIAEKEMDNGIYGQFFMKFKQQELQYPDGSKNNVGIVYCVVLNNDNSEEMIDAFCVPAYPFFIKSLAEIECFDEMVDEFVEELGLNEEEEVVIKA